MKPADQLLAELLPIWQQALGLSRVCHIHPQPDSINVHAAGYRADETEPSVFLKLSRNRPRPYEQELVSARAMQSCGYERTILAHGEAADGIRWLALPWLPHEDFANPTPADLRAAGRTLGELHARTTGYTGAEMRRFTLQRELDRQLTKVETSHPVLHAEMQARIDRLRAASGGWEAYEASLPQCLLHGDFGWRNLVRVPTGGLQLIDFEHSALGPNWMDFGKVLDGELADPQDRAVFLAGYAEAFEGALPPLAEHYFWGLRLWQGLAILQYCSVYPDDQFRAFGERMLIRFDEQFGGPLAGKPL